MTYETLKTDFEREMILMFVLLMRKNKISDLRARLISKAFLDVLKISNGCKEFLNNLSRICPQYPEIIEAFIKVSNNYENVSVKDKLSNSKFYLQKGQIDAALLVLREEIN